MKKYGILQFCVTGLLLVVLSLSLRAQGNIDWDEQWVILQPDSATGPYGWMAGMLQYTGLAYDKWRDVLYVVNPAMCVSGPNAYPCPKVRILDAKTGLPKTSLGRSAATGLGGELPVPPDTIVTLQGWPNNQYGSYKQGQFSLYKIDLDDEGRIFACNLVSPVWGICFPGPPPNCDPIYLNQGPFRVYRWDSPSSTPKRAYATLNSTYDGTGALQNSEMAWWRWGDAFDVAGKRLQVSPPSPPITVDSVRIFVSGGTNIGTSPTPSDQLYVLLTDTRTPGISNGVGSNLDYRLGIRLTSTTMGIAAHGIAATGSSATSEIWMDNNEGLTTLNNQRQTSTPFPQTLEMTLNHTLSDNQVSGTGLSGPLAYIERWKSLICADGLPSNIGNPGQPNTNTRARLMDVSVRGKETREPGYGDTPLLGIRTLTSNGGSNTYISDVDFKLEVDTVSGLEYLTVFVLMSNNGIAAYRSRRSRPIELRSFAALLLENRVALRWEVETEENNYGFDIQRSFNGGNTWESIGFVAGRGTTRETCTYTFDDPLSPIHHSVGSVKYRLKQIDINGSYQIFSTAEVFISDIDAGIHLSQNFPNPFNPITTINYRLDKPGLAQIKIFNTLGEELGILVHEYKDAGSHSVQFTSGKLPSGAYIYQLNVDGNISQRTMLLMK